MVKPEESVPGADGAPSEEELRAAIEEEVRKLRVEDLLMQSVASILNLAARRIVKEDERDLEQARVGIDAVRALVDLLGEGAAPVRQALSEIQVLYAQAASGGEPGAPGPPAPEPAEEPGPAQGERPSGLWTPPGS